MKKRHEFNILPDLSGNDYKRLRNDMQLNGFDSNFPIILYEGDILDGWQREQISQELRIKAVYKDFKGTRVEAAQFMLRTNKRRNLTSSQWAAIAAESTDLMNELKDQAKARQKASLKQGDKTPVTQKIGERDKGESTEKAAELFNTNPEYVRKAKKLYIEDPKNFEAVKKGEKSISSVQREKSPVKTPKEALKQVKNDKTNSFFYETNNLLTNGLDRIERILQKEHIPKTDREFVQIDAINHNMYRAIRLAGQMGVNVIEVWEKMAGRHGLDFKTPKHLQEPKKVRRRNTDQINDAEIIN